MARIEPVASNLNLSARHYAPGRSFVIFCVRQKTVFLYENVNKKLLSKGTMTNTENLIVSNIENL